MCQEKFERLLQKIHSLKLLTPVFLPSCITLLASLTPCANPKTTSLDPQLVATSIALVVNVGEAGVILGKSIGHRVVLARYFSNNKTKQSVNRTDSRISGPCTYHFKEEKKHQQSIGTTDIERNSFW